MLARKKISEKKKAVGGERQWEKKKGVEIVIKK